MGNKVNDMLERARGLSQGIMYYQSATVQKKVDTIFADRASFVAQLEEYNEKTLLGLLTSPEMESIKTVLLTRPVYKVRIVPPRTEDPHVEDVTAYIVCEILPLVNKQYIRLFLRLIDGVVHNSHVSLEIDGLVIDNLGSMIAALDAHKK